MLDWNHETRASAETMLKHPWLNETSDSADFKYTDHEYERMMLKKDVKISVKGKTTQQDDEMDDRQEMNELIESDAEIYGADYDIPKPKKKSEKEQLKADMKKQLNYKSMVGPDGQISLNNVKDDGHLSDPFDEDEISLEDPEEGR